MTHSVNLAFTAFCYSCKSKLPTKAAQKTKFGFSIRTLCQIYGRACVRLILASVALLTYTYGVPRVSAPTCIPNNFRSHKMYIEFESSSRDLKSTMIPQNNQLRPNMMFVPAISFRQPYPKNRPLNNRFEPGPYDVICGRGKTVFWHPGNQELREMIDNNADRYKRAKSKLDKSLIVIEIVDLVRSKSPSGGFVKKQKTAQGRTHWVEVGDAHAREKVGSAFRTASNGKQGINHPSKRRLATPASISKRPRSPVNSSDDTPLVKHELSSNGKDIALLSLMTSTIQVDDLEPLDIHDTLDCDLFDASFENSLNSLLDNNFQECSAQ